MNMQAMENPQYDIFMQFLETLALCPAVVSKKTLLLAHSENAIPHFLVKNQPKSYQFHQNHPHLIMYDLQILVVLKKI